MTGGASAPPVKLCGVPGCRLQRIALDWTGPPEWAAALVREDPRPFALAGDWAGGGAIVGSAPVRVAREDEDPFALLDALPEVERDGVTAADAVGGGWFGWLGYGLGRRVERVSAGPPRPVALPDFALAYYDHVLRLDPAGTWWFEALWTPERADALAERLEVLRARLGAARPRPFAVGELRPVPGWSGHAAAVAACRERIHAGDLFQANLAVRLEGALEGDPLDAWAAGVAALRPARAAFVGGVGESGGAVASLSPELFLERRGTGRAVRTAPIKGTRPLDQRAALAASAKDRAENVMIVDLMRNDLGRVCEPGSVEVTALCDIRRHTGVWHSVSEVVGRLRDGDGDGALVRAAFPPGSVTGAPKPAALDVIAELESTGREAYTGAIGFASPVAGLELNVAIRTFEVRDGRVWLGVGGGVVADSDPAAEAAECATKAAPLLAALGAPPLAAPAVVRAGRRPARLGPRPAARPDPARGIFETVLARDGTAVLADRHLARMAASAAELYGLALPDEAARLLREAAAASREPARVRLDLKPDGAVSVRRGPLPAADGPVELHSFVVPGGLGAHKWADRRLLDALSAHAAPAVPLLVDLDGLVLEASRANVLIREGARLLTPPGDGRILPGITRGGLAAEEEPITLERLLRADAVLLSGALRGVEEVAVYDGMARLDKP